MAGDRCCVFLDKDQGILNAACRGVNFSKFTFDCSFLMWLYDKYSPISYQNIQPIRTEHDGHIPINSDPGNSRIFIFKECMWFCLTALTPQGGNAKELVRQITVRVLVDFWVKQGILIKF